MSKPPLNHVPAIQCS